MKLLVKQLCEEHPFPLAGWISWSDFRDSDLKAPRFPTVAFYRSPPSQNATWLLPLLPDWKQHLGSCGPGRAGFIAPTRQRRSLSPQAARGHLLSRPRWRGQLCPRIPWTGFVWLSSCLVLCPPWGTFSSQPGWLLGYTLAPCFLKFSFLVVKYTE